VVERWRTGKLRGYGAGEIKSSWDFVDNSDPVITAATASEGDENNLTQWQCDFVGGDIVLDVVGDALAEGLNCEAEQSTFDRNTIPS
jgi:hypothetical protein